MGTWGTGLFESDAACDVRDWLEREAAPDTVLALAWCVRQRRSRQPGAGPLMRAVLHRAALLAAEGEGLDERRAVRRRVYRQIALRLAPEGR